MGFLFLVLYPRVLLLLPVLPPQHSLTHTHTHTCSEISYRITDVECISRAQTTQLKLTGMVGRFEVRNLSEEILSTPLLKATKGSDAAQSPINREATVPSDDVGKIQIAKTVQTGKQFVEIGLVVLGLATAHV